MDGTLSRTDTLLEAALLFARQRPFAALRMLLWLLRGRAYFKARLAEAVRLDPRKLPYNEELLRFLRAERDRGRTLVLATASHRRFAESVAGHLGIFDAVHATEADNLKGARKAALLGATYGERRYAYAGDSASDLPVWAGAGSAVLVDVARSVRRRLPADVPVEREFASGTSRLRELGRAARPHQWVKNILVFVPLVTAHLYGSSQAVLAAAGAFLAMCLAASAVYIGNDLLDLPADRAHATKRLRPFAAGTLPLVWGLAAIPALLALAALAASVLPFAFGLALAGYVVSSLVYTVWIKGIPWLDAAWLAALYTFRIYLGALAVDIRVSGWLFAFAACAFLSLALLKRYTEIDAGGGDGADRRVRGYRIVHVHWVRRAGVASAVLAMAVLALYIDSHTATVLYRQPRLLWGIVPLLGYLLLAAWRDATNGRMHDDPIVYALERPGAYVVAVAAAALVLFAH